MAYGDGGGTPASERKLKSESAPSARSALASAIPFGSSPNPFIPCCIHSSAAVTARGGGIRAGLRARCRVCHEYGGADEYGGGERGSSR